MGQLHFPEQHFSQLLRGTDVESVSGFVVDHLLHFLDLFRQVHAEVLYALPVNGNAVVFHCRQHHGQLLFKVQQTGHALFLHQLLHSGVQLRESRQIGIFTCTAGIGHMIGHAEPFDLIGGRGGVQQIRSQFRIFCRRAAAVRRDALCQQKPILGLCPERQTRHLKQLFPQGSICRSVHRFRRAGVVYADAAAVKQTAGQFRFVSTPCVQQSRRQGLFRQRLLLFCRLCRFCCGSICSGKLQLFQQFCHFQFQQQPADFLGLHRLGQIVLHVHVDRHIGHDRCQPLALLCRVLSGSQLIVHRLGEPCLVQMSIEIFHSSPRLNQLGSSLLSYAGYTGDVVRTVPHESFQVNQGQWSKTVLFLKTLRRIGNGFLVGSKPHCHMIADQLQAVPVPCQDHTVRILCRTCRRQRSQNIICFVALTGDDRNSQQCQQLLHIGQLHGKFFGHALAVRLIGGNCLVTERGLSQVKCHSHSIWLHLVPIFQVNIHKAENGMGKHALCIAERTNPVECTVQDTVSVNGK